MEKCCRFERNIINSMLAALFCCFLSAHAFAEQPKVPPSYQPKWKPIANDGLHDPSANAVGILQEPGEALSRLPIDTTGNQVRWADALRDGYIEPRTNIHPDVEIELLDMDIVMGNTGEMPLVLFPHDTHTEWLACSNCHDQIFVRKVDGNPMNMFSILSGEYCGRCHGAVSFPLTECSRCHSIPRNTFKGKFGIQP